MDFKMEFINKYILKFSVWFFIKKGYQLRFETSPSTNDEMCKCLKNKGFVEQTNGWFVKGFVYVRFLNDCFEIKTVDYKSKSIYISHGNYTIDSYIKYLKNSIK